MKWVTDILELTDQYIAEHDPGKTPERIFIEFEEIERVHKDFAVYLDGEGIEFEGMKKSKSELARRKIFIKWYVAKYSERSVEDCVRDLTIILFISESTVYHALYDYR